MDYDSKNLSTESLSFETTQIENTEAKAFSTRQKMSKGILRSFICKQPEWFRRPDYAKNRFGDSVEFRNIRLETREKSIVSAHVICPKEINTDTAFIVLIHGRQTNRYQFGKRFPVLEIVSRNVCLMIPDVRGFGDSPDPYDVDKINADIERCIDYLAGVYTATKITFVTHCIGAGIALQYYKYSTAHMVSPLIHKIVLISPCISEYDLAIKKLGFRFIDKFSKQEGLYNHLSHNNLELIQHVPGNKIVVVHGLKDQHVPYEHGLLLANAVGCKLYRSENDNYYSILTNLDVMNIIHEVINQNE